MSYFIRVRPDGDTWTWAAIEETDGVKDQLGLGEGYASRDAAVEAAEAAYPEATSVDG